MRRLWPEELARAGLANVNCTVRVMMISIIITIVDFDIALNTNISTPIIHVQVQFLSEGI